MILVTGGAGFIGSNFVLDWLARRRRAGRQPRRAHLRRQHREPGVARRRRAPRVRPAATSATARWSTACSRRTGRARSCTSPPRATSTAPSTARPSSSGPTSWAPSRCSRRRARTGRSCRPTRSRRSASCTSRPTRSTARLGPDDPAFTRDRHLRAEQPVFGEQGGERSPGPRLAPHLRPADADDQLLATTTARSTSPRS